MVRTFVAYRYAREEHILAWIESKDKIELSYHGKSPLGPNPYSTCGGVLCTNTAFSFSKKLLQEIVDKMEDGDELHICSPYKIDSLKDFFVLNKP